MSFVIATLDGHALVELRVTLRRGAQPSTFEAVTTDKAPAIGAPVVLRVADAGTARELRQFAVTRVDDLGDGRLRVHGADVRHGWSQRPVSARLGFGPDERLPLQKLVAQLFTLAGVDNPPAAPAATGASIDCIAMPLGAAVAMAAARCGLTLGVDDNGGVRFTPAQAWPEPDALRVISFEVSADAGGPQAVTGGAALELLRVTGWQAVLPGDGSPEFPQGQYFALSAVLAAWGVTELQARRAALHEGGFEKLIARTSPRGAQRLEILRRHAFRLFRATDFAGPWLPVGGVNADGSLGAPRLECGGHRPAGVAPESAAVDPMADSGLAPVRDGFALDCTRGLVRVQHPPYALGGGDATLQSRRLVGEPRLRLTIAVASARASFLHGQGAAVAAPHLVAVYDDGVMLNRGALAQAAGRLLHEATSRAECMLAGVDGALAEGGRESVEIAAGEHGLTTRLIDAPLVSPPFAAPRQETTADDDPVSPLPGGPHQPLNLYRAGPLVLAAAGTAPETESALAARATARDARTGNLELADFGPLAFPFYLGSLDTARHGRWFFVAGVETGPDDELLVLPQDGRHAPVTAADFSPVRLRRPEGLRGLLVGLADQPRFLDAGPLVAHARGPARGECSNLVADLDGSRLSATRRGGLQFLTVLALSPVHRAANTGGGPGWVPALNLRDGDTQEDATCGRGLYAEDDGRSLGRLSAHNQGGPVLADAHHCAKHLYGAATDDGLYRESAGHISTESFFKVPRDPVHDAPLAFYAQPFEGAPPPWPPFEAQIKYDETVLHRWNRQSRPGQWRIQYRVPFLPGIPPTWRPRIKEPPPEPPVAPPRVPAMILPPESVRPVVTEHELWAPSHDWLPLPSRPGPERDLPLRGPAIASEGWAAESDHAPDPSVGGGCIYLPPGRPLPLAQTDGGTRQTFVLLHPEVLLAFGMPHHGLGRVHSGWQVALVDGDLAFTPVDEDALRAAERALRVNADLEVTGKLTVDGLIDPSGLELVPQQANPGGVAGNTIWLDANDDNRARVGDARLALTTELEALRAEVEALRAEVGPLRARLDAG